MWNPDAMGVALMEKEEVVLSLKSMGPCIRRLEVLKKESGNLLFRNVTEDEEEVGKSQW